MSDETPRSRRARTAAESALVRVVHHYGMRPEFVVLGGLVPELLCAGSEFQHAGTTDIDVQVNLEIACGSVNTERLERALRNAEFEPEANHWRWSAPGPERRTVVNSSYWLTWMMHRPEQRSCDMAASSWERPICAVQDLQHVMSRSENSRHASVKTNERWR